MRIEKSMKFLLCVSFLKYPAAGIMPGSNGGSSQIKTNILVKLSGTVRKRRDIRMAIVEFGYG